jgi:hypothetical protein
MIGYPRPMLRRLSFLLALALVAGCDGAGPPVDVDVSYVIVRIAIDPITVIGELFRDAPEVAAAYEGGFDLLSCDGDLALALHFTGEGFAEPRGLGELSFLAVTPAGTSDLCAGGGVAEVQPLSYVSPTVREPLVQGPGWLDGATVDARIPLGHFPGLQIFPEWWRASARGRELPPAPDGTRQFELTEGEASTVWSPALLSGAAVPPAAGFPEGATPLDVLVSLDLQPDIDVDNDGLETYHDTNFDGVVDRCIDGDGTVIEGRDCPYATGLEDGYELIIRFRLARLDRLEG